MTSNLEIGRLFNLFAGTADLVSFGAPFIANPDLVERFERHLPLSESNRDTYYTGGENGYADYPGAL